MVWIFRVGVLGRFWRVSEQVGNGVSGINKVCRYVKRTEDLPVSLVRLNAVHNGEREFPLRQILCKTFVGCVLEFVSD
jgi:hypothetical protein